MSNINQSLGSSFTRVLVFLNLCKIEFKFFKSQCPNKDINYWLGVGIKAIENVERQCRKILGNASNEAMNQQLDEERLLKISRINQILSKLDNETLDIIETQFEEAVVK